MNLLALSCPVTTGTRFRISDGQRFMHVEVLQELTAEAACALEPETYQKAMENAQGNAVYWVAIDEVSR